MPTYDGKNDWRPYCIQFNHIADRHSWKNQQRLDKLIECLRDQALKCFTSRSNSAAKLPINLQVKVITKFPNSEQSNKGKVQTHNYINRQNQSTTGKL